MISEEIFGLWGHTKNSLFHRWSKFSENDFENSRKKIFRITHLIQGKIRRLRDQELSPRDIKIDNYEYESHRIDTLPMRSDTSLPDEEVRQRSRNAEFDQRYNTQGLDI